MRKLFLSLAAAVVTMTGAALMPSNAGAAVVAPSAMQPAVEHTNVVDNVAWFRVCDHHWRSSNRHCRNVWRGHSHHHHGHRHHHHHGHHHRHRR